MSTPLFATLSTTQPPGAKLKMSPKSLGKTLAHYRQRVSGGRYFDSTTDRKSVAHWRVVVARPLAEPTTSAGMSIDDDTLDDIMNGAAPITASVPVTGTSTSTTNNMMNVTRAPEPPCAHDWLARSGPLGTGRGCTRCGRQEMLHAHPTVQ